MPPPDAAQAWLQQRDHSPHAVSADTLARNLGPSPWLVVVPHDDDLVLGCGLLLTLAARAGIEVHVAVCTDGSLGYVQLEERPRLATTRRAEMLQALQALGLHADRLVWLDFPDGSLANQLGARDAAHPPGLGQALTGVMRRIQPRVVLGCHEYDVHPDHRAVAWDTAIACFWASSDIWRELGPPIAEPTRLQYGVYAAFDGPPDFRLHGDDRAQADKLRALSAFESQQVIRQLVEQARSDGPWEFFRRAEQRPHRPTSYAHLFSEPAPRARSTALRSDLQRIAPLLAAWPQHAWPPLVRALTAASNDAPLWLIGEGSSLAFPAGFAQWLARRWGVGAKLVRAGGREAALHGPPAERRCLLSNSGRTRELCELPDRPHLLLTCQADSPLAKRATHVHVLDAPEQAVAASVSVLAQALTLAHALAESCGRTLPIAALAKAAAGPMHAPEEQLLALEHHRRLWWVDPGHHLADELVLKSMEIAGIGAQSAQGTALLHGPVEVLGPRDAVLWIDPPEADREQIHEQLVGRAGATLLYLTEDPRLSRECSELLPLLQLVRSLHLLLALAERLGRNPDQPRRARKVGNPA